MFPARSATLDVARTRRFVALPVCAALLAFLLISLAAPGRAAAAPPACSAGPDAPRDINTYLLFAYTDLYIKGATPSQPGRGLFTGGNIGANGFAGGANDPNLTFASNYGAFLSDGYAAVADHMSLGPGNPQLLASVWDAYANVITNNDFIPASIRNSGPICFTPPILDPGLPSHVAFTHSGGPYNPVLPSFPSFAVLDAQPDVNVLTNGSLNLSPGDYGEVDVNDDATLNLDNGIYNLLALRTGKNVTINTEAGTEVRIAADFRSNDNITIQGSDLARFYVRSDGIGPTTFSVAFGWNTQPGCPEEISVHGQFFVPNGRVNLGDCTNLYGRFWVDVLRNDNNINVTFRAAGALTGTKYHDRNADGIIQPSEPGLEGFVFYVDYNDNGQLDPGEPSGTSDANGNYSIEDVLPGTWTVREVSQPGYTCSIPAGNCTHTVTVGQGAAATGIDFANHSRPDPRHFQCYEIHRVPLNRPGVKLVDAFGTSMATIEKAKRICTPASKNGEDPTAPAAPEHMTNYTIKQTSPKFKKIKGVTIQNQFGTTIAAVTRPDRLLVPTSKGLTGPPAALTNPPEHFKCYRTAGVKINKPTVTVEDQFGTITVQLKKLLHFCPPVDKNDEGIFITNKSLACYQSVGLPPSNRPQIWTENQFGPDGPYLFYGPRELCVPGTHSIPAPV